MELRYIIRMDFNHDFNGDNVFLLSGAKERLQSVKAAVLSFGDMGYTDPEVPDIRYAIGDYTDPAGHRALENAIREILITSMIVRPEEIVGINVVSPVGGNGFVVRLDFTFGTTQIDHPAISGE